MIRLVLAVALAVALVAATLPAIEKARQDRGRVAAERSLDRLAAAASDLTARDAAVRPGARGARRVLRLCLPRRSWTRAGVTALALTATDGAGTRVGYRVGDGREVERRLPVALWPLDGDATHADGTEEGPTLSLSPGCHRLVLAAVRRDGAVGVTVRRV